ncbi:MFS transporter [Halorussus sp. AFM4]|uniref:MFS transporter n=1 Tax=Halorussus sp. AFM4 TaxID=3421651 RepID=UPI003EBD683D
MNITRRDWRYTVCVVTGGHFLSHFYLLTFPPLVGPLRAEFGLSNTGLGVLVSVISLGLLLQLPVGQLVDRVGAKRVFVAGVALTAAGVGLAGFATSYLGLVAGAVVSGVGQSAFHPADYSLLDAVTGEGNEGKSFGVHTFGAYAGFAAAPVVVGGIALRADWRIALLSVGGAGVLYAAVAALTLDSPYRRQLAAAPASDDGGTIRDALSTVWSPPVLLLLCFFVALTMASKGVQTFTAVLVSTVYGLPESVGNLTLTGFFAGASVGILTGGVVADRFDPRRTIVSALAVSGAGTLALTLGPVPSHPVASVGGFAVIGFVMGLAYPSRDRLVSRYTPSGSTGKGFGLIFTGASVGGLVGPALLGGVTDATTVTVTFVLVAAFFLAAGFVAFALRWQSRSAVEAAPSGGD